MKKNKFNLLLACVLGLFSTQANAKISLPSVFGDNMVLQQKSNVKFWGNSTHSNATVNIQTEWDKKTYTVKVNADGTWSTSINTPKFGGPYSIILDDGDRLILNNVLIGEVWFCSGQSNMEMPLAGWGKVQDYEKEIAQANFPRIRFLQVKQQTSNMPVDHAEVAWNGWNTVSPETIAEFSSTAYFFARQVYEQTGVPIGLIHSSWGGTIIEAWTSRETLAQYKQFSSALNRLASPTAQADYENELGIWKRLVEDNDKGREKNGLGWLAKGVNDESWDRINLPNYFDSELYPGIDGIVYFRKKITVPESWVGKALKLSLGPVDDEDVTYVNETFIGETHGYNVDRSYTIPAKVVTSRELRLAIRVFDGAGGGGIYGDASKLKLIGPDGQELSLTGEWKCQLGLNLKDMPTMPAPMEGGNRPSVLYNAMVQPFIDFKIAGVIWYQGEANAERAQEYRKLFPSLIHDWRTKWGQKDLPFYYVQLANYMKKEEVSVQSSWAELREAQQGALSLPNTGMAVISDIGDAEDIHPKNKQEVGRRLGLIALNRSYGKHIPYSGPVLKDWKVQGAEITLTFSPMARKLVNGQQDRRLTGFTIAGEDKVFYLAEAKLVGNKVIVSSPLVKKPLAVRYGWANNPTLSIYNDAGLPASPFRTDKWEVNTSIEQK